MSLRSSRGKSRSPGPSRSSKNLQPLLARHEVSDQQAFDAEKALDAARLQQETAEATLHAMMIGPRPEAVAEAEGRIKTAEGLVEFSQAHLDLHTIRARSTVCSTA